VLLLRAVGQSRKEEHAASWAQLLQFGVVLRGQALNHGARVYWQALLLARQDPESLTRHCAACAACAWRL
jgi:hypothetical protein